MELEKHEKDGSHCILQSVTKEQHKTLAGSQCKHPKYETHRVGKDQKSGSYHGSVYSKGFITRGSRWMSSQLARITMMKKGSGVRDTGNEDAF